MMKGQNALVTLLDLNAYIVQSSTSTSKKSGEEEPHTLGTKSSVKLMKNSLLHYEYNW